jgi:cell division transport system permease protein
MSKRKQDAKTFANQKRFKRRWITLLRMFRYGMDNFSRNIWLTVAATAVMTITLLVVFVTFAARSVLIDTVGEIRDKVDMSIYVKTDIDDKDVKTIRTSLEKLSTVKHVLYISPSDARTSFAQNNKTNSNALEALNEATNHFPGTFRITPIDINKTDELRKFVETNSTLKDNLDPNRAPSFAGQRRTAIDRIGSWVSFAEKAGLLASVVFIAISSLIIFNTIRMAIFNRKDEIQMMKLIGADRGFIRGPFIVEAAGYGFIAALIATLIGIILLQVSSGPLLSYGIKVGGLLDQTMHYVFLVTIIMILLGCMIGIISSLLATRRYLKI